MRHNARSEKKNLKIATFILIQKHCVSKLVKTKKNKKKAKKAAPKLKTYF